MSKANIERNSQSTTATKLLAPDIQKVIQLIQDEASFHAKAGRNVTHDLLHDCAIRLANHFAKAVPHELVPVEVTMITPELANDAAKFAEAIRATNWADPPSLGRHMLVRGALEILDRVASMRPQVMKKNSSQVHT